MSYVSSASLEHFRFHRKQSQDSIFVIIEGRKKCNLLVKVGFGCLNSCKIDVAMVKETAESITVESITMKYPLGNTLAICFFRFTCFLFFFLFFFFLAKYTVISSHIFNDTTSNYSKHTTGA